MTEQGGPLDTTGLTSANAARASDAGREAARLARRLLELPRGQDLPQAKRDLLAARADFPDASWAEVAEKVGLGKDQAIGQFRRLTAGLTT